MNLVQLLTKGKKNQIGTLGHQVGLFLGMGTLSGTSERACLLQFRGQSPPPLPSLPYAISSHSQEGAGRETGHLLSVSFARTWSSLNVGPPSTWPGSSVLLCTLPGNFSLSRHFPLLNTMVPTQTQTASSPRGRSLAAHGHPNHTFARW